LFFVVLSHRAKRRNDRSKQERVMEPKRWSDALHTTTLGPQLPWREGVETRYSRVITGSDVRNLEMATMAGVLSIPSSRQSSLFMKDTGRRESSKTGKSFTTGGLANPSFALYFQRAVEHDSVLVREKEQVLFKGGKVSGYLGELEAIGLSLRQHFRKEFRQVNENEQFGKRGEPK